MGDSKELWPRAKLAGFAEKARAAGAAPREGYALLLTTGGMNPVHSGHVQLLHQAEQRLTAEGYSVLGAWLSPSHDMYLLPKAQSLRTLGLSGSMRLEIARRATLRDPLVDVGAWECAQEGYWPDFPEVCAALQSEFGSAAELKGLPGVEGEEASFKVFYACGTDHAEKCGLYFGLPGLNGLGVVVVPRAGESARNENPGRSVFVANPAEGDIASFSSTKVRKAIENNDSDYLQRALSPEAAHFLLRPTKEDYTAFPEDFSKLGRSPVGR